MKNVTTMKPYSTIIIAIILGIRLHLAAGSDKVCN